jgi:hypothetical protein
MGLFTSLLICLVIQLVVSLVLSAMGVAVYIIDIATSFALALFFSILTYRRDPQGIWKNPRFHKSFVTLFIVLLAATFVMGYLL